jgi:zinc/manganese transport system substrate-binding protein
MRRLILLSTALTVLLVSGPARAKVNIVCTIPDLCDIAQNVGGSLVSTTTLGKGFQDPHFVDPKPSFALAMRNADLLLLVGLELEVGWLPTLLTGARNGRIQAGQNGYFDCSTVAKILEVPSQKISRAMGDLHPGGNPHYWMDPRNGIRIAFGVMVRLGKLDPANQATYKASYQAYARQIMNTAKAMKAKIAPYAGAYLIPYHASMIYFIEWAGLKQLATVERLPGVPPSAAHLAKLHQLIGATPGRKAIVSETYYPATEAKRVAARFGLRFVHLAHMVGGLPAVSSYLDLLRHNVDLVTAALAASSTR